MSHYHCRAQYDHSHGLPTPQRYYKDKICKDHRLVVTASFAFCVTTFEPIEAQTHSAPQNDRLNLSFVKDTYVVGKKVTRNGGKMSIFET